MQTDSREPFIFGSPFFDRALPGMRAQLAEFRTRLEPLQNPVASRVLENMAAFEDSLTQLEREAKRIALQSQANDHLAAAASLKQQISELD
jgi:hypothetical protein